jgi:hypothetical protein
MTRDRIRAVLGPHLDVPARAWLDAAEEEIGRDRSAILRHLPAAARRVGRGPLDGDTEPTASGDMAGAEVDLAGWTVDDAARAVLLLAIPLDGDALAAMLADLYRHGDAAERRGILRALAVLPVGAAALDLVREALRTSDDHLIEAALGPYAARHLEPDLWRQAVLKCVFNGIHLRTVAELHELADRELARMLADYAHERIAAGRGVPADIWPVMDRFPGVLEASGVPGELRSNVPDRRRAAERAMAERAATTHEVA